MLVRPTTCRDDVLSPVCRFGDAGVRQHDGVLVLSLPWHVVSQRQHDGKLDIQLAFQFELLVITVQACLDALLLVVINTLLALGMFEPFDGELGVAD